MRRFVLKNAPKKKEFNSKTHKKIICGACKGSGRYTLYYDGGLCKYELCTSCYGERFRIEKREKK